MVGINWPAFRGEERQAAQLISHNLFSLDHHVRLFRTALALADYCDSTRAEFRGLVMAPSGSSMDRYYDAMQRNLQFIEWKILAMRDAAITLNNFAECKQALEKLIGKCPSFQDKLDREAYREAGRIWEKEFPGYADIRLSVAHSGKLFNAPGKRQEHTVPGTDTVMGVMVDERTMSTSIGGKMPTYSLVEETAVTLENIRDAIYRAYAPISDYSRQLPTIHEETPQPPAED